MLTLLSKEQIKRSQEETLWDHGNSILYDLCKNNFKHKRDDVIITKVLFVGRIYAAALERRKNKKNGDTSTFYIKRVVPAFRKSKLDDRLAKLSKIKALSIDDIPFVLKTHNDLMKTLNKITGYNNRSFCSKYLHFHLPNLFFLYDSIASRNLRDFKSKVSIDLMDILKRKDIDIEYSKYFCRCFDFRNDINHRYNTKLTTRQIDNLLLKVNL